VLVEEGEKTTTAGNNDGTNGSGRTLGAHLLGTHLLGTHAEEIINIFALAIRLGLNITDIQDAIFSYPTKSSDISYIR
jgi:pyruvate/2-oxoglutarate dehydrogenase complex dihydrolipoamide dehydrogenase (E3) component